MSSTDKITVVEVGPRDGFQPIGPFIPTETKIALIEELYKAGIRRMEATAFVSAKAVPQMADAVDILTACNRFGDLDVQVLVPSARYADQALAAGAMHLSFVLSVSEKHNMNNVRRTTADSLAEFAQTAKALPSDTKIRLNLATSFDCPFDGAVSPQRVLEVVEGLAAASANAEIALCDTTGRTTPDAVSYLCREVLTRFPGRNWAFHGHDTYGLGAANVLAAIDAGFTVVDASFGGLGGCPFAPGATGNVATEDVVWTLHKMGIDTGISLEALLDASVQAAALPGASAGGRVRAALRGAQPCAGMEVA
nr:hydroxymethylglutaryl-CoA lyase [Sphingomonas sp. CDS-1]